MNYLDGKRTEFQEDSDLFWALRGGGAGPWGVVTAMTLKVHKNRDDCRSNCYQVTNAAWVANINEDVGRLAEKLMEVWFEWGAQASEYWGGYLLTFPLDDLGNYMVNLSELTYAGSAGDEDAMDIENYFR